MAQDTEVDGDWLTLRGLAPRSAQTLKLPRSSGRAGCLCRRCGSRYLGSVPTTVPIQSIAFGADAIGAWEKKEAAFAAELERWRSVGEATAYAGAAIKPVGG